MSEAIILDDLHIAVKRSSKRKTIGVTVERDASVVAHLPESTTLTEASDLIRGRLVWVYQKIASKKEDHSAGAFRVPEFVDGEGFHFLGQHYRLKLIDSDRKDGPVPAVRFEGDRLLFNRAQIAFGQMRIAAYYARAARPYLNRAVKQWKSLVGVAPAKFVEVMDLGFRWGSCSADGRLNFHWRVMQLPPPVIDYVVVHELVHLKVRDHSAAFWGEVRRVLPNFEAHRDWLRQKGGDL